MALVGYPTSVPVWVSFLPPQALPKIYLSYLSNKKRNTGSGWVSLQSDETSWGADLHWAIHASQNPSPPEERHVALRPFIFPCFFFLFFSFSVFLCVWGFSLGFFLLNFHLFFFSPARPPRSGGVLLFLPFFLLLSSLSSVDGVGVPVLKTPGPRPGFPFHFFFILFPVLALGVFWVEKNKKQNPPESRF